MVKLTPPMGWNSWNTFGENINEKLAHGNCGQNGGAGAFGLRI